jgi:thiol-disulfide isomerase/thioredoxin
MTRTRKLAWTLVLGMLAGCDASPALGEQSPGPTSQKQAQRGPEPDSPQVPRPRAGQDRVGEPAPGWPEDLRWLQSEPLQLKELRGKVVLIRFWTDTCPYCEASAPAFNEIHEDYAGTELQVLGFYHPKPFGKEPVMEDVRARLDEFGWEFPVAIDARWKALRAFWLTGPDRDATSSSFLLDREGVIRWVHPGPELHPGGPEDHEQCRRDYQQLRQALDALL